jgi:RNA polymerase sigma factor (sigma-70 family)
MTEAERRVYEATRIPVAIYSYRDGKVITDLVSDGYCEMVGMERERITSLLDSSMFGRVHPDDAGRLASIGQQFALKQSGYDVLYRTRLKGSKEYSFLHTVGRWQKMEDGLEPASPKSYLSSIVHNACVDRLRREASHPFSGLPSDMEAPVSDEEALDRSFAEAWLWTAIDELPEGRRRMLLMHKREGLSCAEIASRLGVSEGTVKNQISRALKSLRKGAWKIFS